jgi:hypothetical protein
LCCRPESIPHHVDTQWMADGVAVFPYTSDVPSAITGYVLNNNSSLGSVTVHFLRGGSTGSLLSFHFIVNVGEYKSFTVTGVDTIQIVANSGFSSGELNLTVNF